MHVRSLYHLRIMKATLAIVLVFSTVVIINQNIYLASDDGYTRYILTKRTSCERKTLLKRENDSHSQKLILFWNKLSTFRYYGFHIDQFDFAGICETNRCLTSANRTTFHQADAVIFTIKDITSWKDFPPASFHIHRSTVTGFPRHAHINQVFVMFHIESPNRFRRLPWDKYNQVFNLTYSYLSDPDTDIRIQYGRILPRPKDKPYQMPDNSVLANKTKLVAWVVSNCKPTNLRRQYVEELSKYITVDIYGKCGSLDLNCPFKTDGCFDRLAQSYKFYLAFENSHCKQYVTEKMYRALSLDIIPVVMGGADYRTMFPPHSYIDVRDFKSPKHLAAYLLQLANDTDEYLSYFEWKKTQMADSVHDAAHNLGLCRLCEILHDPHYRYKSECFDYESYYNPSKYCLSRKHERHLIGL